MILLQPKIILMLAKPLLVDVLKDIIASNVTSENLALVRDKVLATIMTLTGKTHFTWDDDLAKLIYDHMLEGKVIDKATEMILDSVEAWVQSTETSWDNELLLPVIDTLRLAIVEDDA
jgi:hypothetical protein